MILRHTHYLVLLPLLSLMAATTVARAQVSGPAQPVVLEHADSLIGRKSAGEQVFDGNVRFVQGVVHIQADRAVYYEATKKILMTGNVHVTQPGMTMTAPRADYDGNTRMAYAPAGVTIQDTSGTLVAGAGDYSAAQKKASFRNGVTYQSGSATLTADAGDYFSFNNHALFRGNVKYQDSGSTLRAEEGEYFSQYKHALFKKNVVYNDGKGAVLTADAGEMFSAEGRSFFNGNVVLKDTSGTIHAGAVDSYSREHRAVFTDGVTVSNDSGSISARELTYHTDTRESFATGNVRVNSLKYSSVLFGDTLRDMPARKYTLVIGNAKMIQIDTVRNGKSPVRYDTTTLTAKQLEAFRAKPAQYVATDDVRMVRGEMEARSYTARYFPDDSLIGLGARVIPPVPDTIAKTILPKDSTAAVKDTVKPRGADTSSAGAVTGAQRPKARRKTESQPVVWYRDAQMIGDTMTIRLVGRRVNTVDVDGDGFIIMKSKRTGRFDQLTGAHVAIAVRQDTIRQVEARGNAASIAFMYDQSRPNGANRVSGETVRIGFTDGQASRITVAGKKARNDGEYFPEGFVAGRETYYRLAGFRWVDRAGGGTLEGGGVDLPEGNVGTAGRRYQAPTPPVTPAPVAPAPVTPTPKKKTKK